MIKQTHTSLLSFFIDFVIEDDMIYFPMANYNAICRGNLVDGQVEIIDIFPDIAEDKKYACTGIYKIKNYLLLYELEGSIAFIYDILQHKFSKLPNGKDIVFFSGTVFEENDYLYIVSIRTAEIYRFDLQNNSLQCFTCKEYISDNVQVGNIVRSDNYIYIPLYREKVMLTFELEREKFECHRYPENISVSYNLAHQGDELWIIGKDKKIYTWNVKEGKVYLCAEFPDDIEQYILEDQCKYMLTFINKDVLWIFPPSNTIIKYSILTKQFDLLKIHDEEAEEGQFIRGYDVVKNINDKAFLLSSQERVLYEVNLLTNNIKKLYFPIVNTFKGQLYPMPVAGRMMEENYTNAFDVLLKSIMNYSENSTMAESVIVGKVINEYINNDNKK